MPGTCITCLSTVNLVNLGDLEWRIFNSLLHPVSKKYPELRTNSLARLCTRCQNSMRFVERFRLSAVKNFEVLMKVWNMSQSSTNVAMNTLSPKIVVVQSLQRPCSRENQNPLPKTTDECNIITVLSHKIKIEKEAEPSERDGEKTLETLCSGPEVVIKTEEIDEIHQEDEIKSERVEDEERTEVVSKGTRMKVSRVFVSPRTTTFQPCVEATTSHPHQRKRNEIKREEMKDKERTEVDSEGTITDEEFAELRDKEESSKEAALPPKSGKSKYWCRYCEKSFVFAGAVTRHEEIKHGNLPTVTCTVCNKMLPHKYSMEAHMRNAHKTKYCEICDKWYSNCSYTKHLKVSPKHNNKEELEALKVSCQICNKVLRTKFGLKSHMQQHNTDAKYCQPCDKWFTPMTYKCHIKTSLKHLSKEDRRFTCDDCGSKFIDKPTLLAHIKTIHLKLKSFKCPQCPLAFSHKTRLNYHIRYVHENVPVPKNHICEVCGHAFTTSSLLRKHMPVHTGERPYKCGKCDATFGHSSALYLHNRYKHEKKKCPPKKKKNVAQNKKEIV